MLRDMVPDGVEVLHASANAAGDKIEIIAIATRIMPARVKRRARRRPVPSSRAR
jgi:hypothetical protein